MVYYSAVKDAICVTDRCADRNATSLVYWLPTCLGRLAESEWLVLWTGGAVLPVNYLADALQPVARIHGRQRLQSSSIMALYVPSTRLSTVGNRAFPVAAARTWNSLPAEVTSSNSLQTFKTKLSLIYSWRRFHSFRIVLVFVKCLKCFGIFSP